MKRLLVSIIVCLFILIGIFPTYSQLLDKDLLLSKLLFENVQLFHYSGPKLDDTYSKQAWTQFIDRLDPNKRFFTQSDIDTLKKYETGVDDEIAEGDLVFYKEAFKLYDIRLNQISEWIPSLLDKPFDFSTREKFQTDPKKRSYVASEAELKALWGKMLGIQVLGEYMRLAEIKKAGSVFYPSLEKEARKKIKKDIEKSFKNLKKEKPADRTAFYFESLMNVFDPHTTYLAPEEKENFNIGMRGTLEGIGAMLKEEEGYIKVTSVVPGGPAWKQKDLKAEDIILKVAQGTQDPVDIVGMSVNDAVKLIRGKKGSEVRLTVKKPGGSVQIITIIRDVVVIEETYAKSALLTTKDHRNIGYIALPVFYHDFDKSNARHASEDIIKAIKNLNKSGISGLILDLRNNSGGALEDAIEISGFFIKTGPVVQVRDNRDDRQVRQDEDANIYYTGPLIVLVNEFSASASEIVAAALQDYKRAIIMGSSHTYGKGTVQTVLDFDRYVDSDTRLSRYASVLKPLGSLKLTIQKFYRINGGTTQYKGVIPDIVIPDAYDYTDMGEKNTPHSLPWDTITPLKYTDWKPSYDLAQLKRNSEARIAQNKLFQLIKANGEELKSQQKDTLQSLNFKKNWETNKAAKLKSEKFKKLQSGKVFFQVPSSNLETVAPEQRDIVKDWFKQISKDPYIDEAIHVLEDIH